MNIYVGNLSYRVTDEELRALFEPYGEVSSVSVIKDRMTQQSRGFGFVEMTRQDEAEHAIKQLNGFNHGGRKLTVNMARPRDENPRPRDENPRPRQWRA